MAGTPLDNFSTFMDSTGPAYLTDVKDVVNEAQKNTYCLKALLRGREQHEIIQGGDSIKDKILLDDQSTYAHYQPNDTFTWQNPQTGHTISVPWRFSIDHMSWTDQEIQLQGGSDTKTSALRGKYKDVRYEKYQRLWTSMLNGMEDDLWANPASQTSAMESSGGNLPYSIPAFITEDTTNYHATGWTTIQGIDPATESGWRNQVSTYDHTDILDSDGDIDGLLNAFDEMFLKVQYESPMLHEEYFTKDNFAKQMILCSMQGINIFKQALRDHNDRTVSPEDPAYNTPRYSGIPLKYISTLDTAALYTSAAETTGEPRYYFVNAKYMKAIFHKDRYIKVHESRSHPNQPFTHVKPVDSWWNLFCRSRKRQGIIAPQSPSN